MTPFLSPEELAELIDSPKRSLQIAWLTERGWVFEISRLGNPKVLRAYVDAKMGLATISAPGQTEPDFSSWQHQTSW